MGSTKGPDDPDMGSNRSGGPPIRVGLGFPTGARIPPLGRLSLNDATAALAAAATLNAARAAVEGCVGGCGGGGPPPPPLVPLSVPFGLPVGGCE